MQMAAILKSRRALLAPSPDPRPEPHESRWGGGGGGCVPPNRRRRWRIDRPTASKCRKLSTCSGCQPAVQGLSSRHAFLCKPPVSRWRAAAAPSNCQGASALRRISDRVPSAPALVCDGIAQGSVLAPRTTMAATSSAVADLLALLTEVAAHSPATPAHPAPDEEAASFSVGLKLRQRLLERRASRLARFLCLQAGGWRSVGSSPCTTPAPSRSPPTSAGSATPPPPWALDAQTSSHPQRKHAAAAAGSSCSSLDGHADPGWSPGNGCGGAGCRRLVRSSTQQTRSPSWPHLRPRLHVGRAHTCLYPSMLQCP